MKKTIKIIILTIIIITVGIGAFIYRKNSQFHYNNKNAVGNTAGNLNNGGKFAEYDGKIYFSNPNDKGRLYVMNSDCTDAKVLSTDIVSSINACGSYIYYVRNNLTRESIVTDSRAQMFGMYRADLNGKRPEVLYKTKAGIASLSGDYLYYQRYSDDEGMSFYKIKIDGTDETKIADTAFNPACVYNNRIYFADPYNNNQIYSLDTTTNKTSLVYSANAYQVDVGDGFIYFIDLSKGYALVRYNTSTKTLEQLYGAKDSKVINFNRYGNRIFFQVEGGENPGLYRIHTDGSNLQYVATGNISAVHCTSKYTFFQYYEDEVSLYRVPTTGNIKTVEEITIK